MNKSQITYKRIEGATVITIQDDLLVFATENNADNQVKVLNKERFASEVAFKLENKLGAHESGLTGFQELLDKAIREVIQDGSESVEDMVTH